MFARFIHALRDLSMSFYVTWLLYATTVGITAVVIAWVLTLVVALWQALQASWRTARWPLSDSWSHTKQFARMFTPRGYREARTRVRR